MLSIYKLASKKIGDVKCKEVGPKRKYDKNISFNFPIHLHVEFRSNETSTVVEA